MKKLTILAGVFFVFALASCKKDYTCTCTTDTAGVTSTATTTIENSTQSDAEEACEAGNTSATVLGITTSVTCTLD